SRREWRDIPVATPGPAYVTMATTMILPDRGRTYSLVGPEQLEGSFANTRLQVNSSLNGDTLKSGFQLWQRLGEVAPGDVAEARRQAQRIVAGKTELVASSATWRWELSDA